MKPYADLAEELFEIMDPARRRPPHAGMDKMMRGEMAVLRLLDEEESCLLAGEISKRLSMTTPRIAAVLNSLEKKAMIVRCADPQDKRRVAVCITQAGREVCSERRACIKRDMRRILERLGERDAAEYVRLTRRAFELMNEQMDEQQKEAFDEKEPV